MSCRYPRYVKYTFHHGWTFKIEEPNQQAFLLSRSEVVEVASCSLLLLGAKRLYPANPKIQKGDCHQNVHTKLGVGWRFLEILQSPGLKKHQWLTSGLLSLRRLLWLHHLIQPWHFVFSATSPNPSPSRENRSVHPAGAMAQLHVASRDWMGCNECSNQLWDSERDLSSSADRKDKQQNMICNMHHVFTTSSGLILAFLRYPAQIGIQKRDHILWVWKNLT